MSGSRFRPSGWSRLRESTSDQSITDLEASDRQDGVGRQVRDFAANGGRKAVSAVFTPVVEKALHRIGYKRVLLTLTAVVAVTVIAFGSLIVIAMASSPAAVPVAIAGKVLSGVTDLFGDGDDDSADTLSPKELAEAGASGAPECRIARVPAGSQAAAPTTTRAPGSAVATTTASGSRPVSAIAVATDGSVSRSDARALIEPVLPGTSALTAHVWFMYRLAGLGDWAAFTAAYERAGLDDGDKDPEAPFKQVQALNPAGVDLSPYRVTAAALTSAAESTGRVKDPYPDYRAVVGKELVAGCIDDPGVSSIRPSMPKPSTSSTPTTSPPATTTAPGR